MIQPRVQAPGTAAKGEIFQVKTLISHPMETGLRHGKDGTRIPRNIINRFTCLYNNVVVFTVDLREAMAANPYLAFYVKANDSGSLHFIWEEDGGTVWTLEKALTVIG